MPTATTQTEAAAVLTEYAEALKDCHTVDGDWRDEHEARAEYERLKKLANALGECMDCGAKAEPGLVLCHQCAKGHYE